MTQPITGALRPSRLVPSALLVLAATLAIALAAAAPGRAHAQQVELRASDRALVRLVAIGGVHRAQTVSWWGTGFFVSRDGTAVTAAHVVENAHALIAVLAADGRVASAEIASIDAEHDLAVIRIDVDSVPEIIDLRVPRPVRVVAGDAVTVAGYSGQDPRERAPAVVVGHVSRMMSAGTIELAAGVNPGQSGGPVLANGALLGVLSARGSPEAGVQSVAFVEPRDRIATLVEAIGARPRAGAPDEALAEIVGYVAGAVAVDRVSTTALERAAGAARTPDERAIVIASAWCRIEELRAMGRARDVALEVWAQRQSAEILGAHPHLRVNYPALGLLTTSATAH